VETGDEAYALDPDREADAPLAAATHGKRALLARAQRARQEDRVRLAGQRRAEATMVQLGDDATERRASKARSCGNGGDRGHAAPVLQVAERPHRNLLERDDVGPVGRDEADHLLEKTASLRRHGVAVEKVPRANEQRHAA
jgi:hypothetical protein